MPYNYHLYVHRRPFQFTKLKEKENYPFRWDKKKKKKKKKRNSEEAEVEREWRKIYIGCLAFKKKAGNSTCWE